LRKIGVLMMRDVVIAGYLRTAQSRSKPNDPKRDWFHKIRSDELMASLLSELVKRTNVDAKEVDDFIVGCAIGFGEQWTFGGRAPLFLANLSEKTAAKFIDQQCGSAMAAVHVGYLEIATGNADIVIAGGMEHMTRVPDTLLDEGANRKLFEEERYQHWDIATSWYMGLTAERLFERTDLTRDELDRWALRSHELAMKAREEGFFEGEVLPIEAEQSDGSVLTVDVDQSVRVGTTLEALAGLKPVFKKNGVVTAGNSSPLNAGATSMILMSKEKAMQKGIDPLSTIRAISFVGVEPSIMGLGPVPATKKVLKMANLGIEDIDYWEINEAFSVVVLNCIRELGIDPERVNIKGGGIALGHPLGATGIRLIGTLARILNEKKARYGIATACVGGGQGVATVIEREDY
jgi:acetyl-CoA C-acetyltransferase